MLGELVTVWSREESGTDAMGDPVFKWSSYKVDGCLVRPLTQSAQPDAESGARPDAAREACSIALPKSYAGPPLAHCFIELTGRGESFDPANPAASLAVVGSPVKTIPCPTSWDTLLEAVRAVG